MQVAFSAPDGKTAAILNRWQRGFWLQYSAVFKRAQRLQGIASKNLMIVSSLI